MKVSFPWLENGWSPRGYEIFRCALGLYLLVHFAALVPWGAELFSSSGMLAEAEASPLILPLVPNPLAIWDTEGVVTAMLGSGVVLSVLVILGYKDRWAAVVLWFLWACLYARNPLIGNPGLPYVGWLLLAHACLPACREWSFAGRPSTRLTSSWRMPPAVFAVAWILLVVGYSYSGLTKLGSPSWIDGTALMHVLENPLARPTPLREWLVSLPEPLMRASTWAALGLEILAAPLALSRRLRPWLWAVLVGLQLSFLVLFDFADLSVGMLLMHLFTFDPGWIRMPWRERLRAATSRIRAHGYGAKWAGLRPC